MYLYSTTNLTIYLLLVTVRLRYYRFWLTWPYSNVYFFDDSIRFCLERIGWFRTIEKGPFQLGANYVCVILSHRHDSITSILIMGFYTKYRLSVIVSRRRNTWKIQKFQIKKKTKKIFCSKNNLKWNFEMCCKDLKRAQLPGIFFCV